MEDLEVELPTDLHFKAKACRTWRSKPRLGVFQLLGSADSTPAPNETYNIHASPGLTDASPRFRTRRLASNVRGRRDIHSELKRPHQTVQATFAQI